MNALPLALKLIGMSESQNGRIGIVGAGRMGANMARRLKECGYQVTAIQDVNRAVAESLAAELGARCCSTLPEVAEAADILITVVTDDAAQRGLFVGEETLLSAPSGCAGKVFINCATVTPSLHQEIEGLCEAVGAASLEACMASSITQAREGSLYLMCAGKREVFDQVLPVLSALGKGPRYVGPAGTAAQVKALVNMVMNINTAGLAEGLGLGAALGLDLGILREVFSETGAASRVLVTDGEDMVKRDHACFFSAAHAAKDSGIALALGREQGLHLPLAQATKAQYDLLVAKGLGELDKSGIAELTFPGRGN